MVDPGSADITADVDFSYLRKMCTSKFSKGKDLASYSVQIIFYVYVVVFVFFSPEENWQNHAVTFTSRKLCTLKIGTSIWPTYSVVAFFKILILVLLTIISICEEIFTCIFSTCDLLVIAFS